MRTAFGLKKWLGSARRKAKGRKGHNRSQTSYTRPSSPRSAPTSPRKSSSVRRLPSFRISVGAGGGLSKRSTAAASPRSPRSAPGVGSGGGSGGGFGSGGGISGGMSGSGISPRKSSKRPKGHYRRRSQSLPPARKTKSATAVKICCRFRPLKGSERPSPNWCVDGPAVAYGEQNFTYHNVFQEDSTQQSVYEDTAAPMIDDFFEGFNCCIFAYGQTGTGKSYTMMGAGRKNHKARGIIPRALEVICTRLETLRNSMEKVTLSLNFVEVYRENLVDLLNPEAKLSIRTAGGISIEGVTNVEVKDQDSIMRCMERGNASRNVQKTQMNSQSSRSHSILQISLRQKDLSHRITKSKLILVDLAGSERSTRTGATGDKQKEGSAINVSLTTLGKVIKALSKRQSHVPFRESKLTLLLSESINGNCKLCMIMTASKAQVDVEETLSTLRFGKSAGSLKNKVVRNRVLDPAAYKRMYTEEKVRADLTERRTENVRAILKGALESHGGKDACVGRSEVHLLQTLKQALTALTAIKEHREEDKQSQGTRRKKPSLKAVARTMVAMGGLLTGGTGGMKPILEAQAGEGEAVDRVSHLVDHPSSTVRQTILVATDEQKSAEIDRTTVIVERLHGKLLAVTEQNKALKDRLSSLNAENKRLRAEKRMLVERSNVSETIPSRQTEVSELALASALRTDVKSTWNMTPKRASLTDDGRLLTDGLTTDGLSTTDRPVVSPPPMLKLNSVGGGGGGSDRSPTIAAQHHTTDTTDLDLTGGTGSSSGFARRARRRMTATWDSFVIKGASAFRAKSPTAASSNSVSPSSRGGGGGTLRQKRLSNVTSSSTDTVVAPSPTTGTVGSGWKLPAHQSGAHRRTYATMRSTSSDSDSRVALSPP